MNLLERIKPVLAAESNDAQLDRYLSEVRESLSASNRQFLAYQALIVGSLVAYYLVVYGRSTDISLYGFPIHDTKLFQRVFLIVPAALLAAMACVGYLRSLQREVFDYLTISRYRVLATTGLHELRLPSDFVLGLFVLKELGGLPEKITSYVVASLCAVTFIFAPITYVTTEAIKNIQLFGAGDLLCLAASLGAISLADCALLVVLFGSLVQAT